MNKMSLEEALSIITTEIYGNSKPRTSTAKRVEALSVVKHALRDLGYISKNSKVRRHEHCTGLFNGSVTVNISFDREHYPYLNEIFGIEKWEKRKHEKSQRKSQRSPKPSRKPGR